MRKFLALIMALTMVLSLATTAFAAEGETATETYSITIKSDIHQKAIDYQKTDEFKEKKKQRYKIEAKNAKLKQSHGFKRCKFAGLFGMKCQAYLTVFVVNAKRIVKLIATNSVIIKRFGLKIRQIMDIFSYTKKRSLLFQK